MQDQKKFGIITPFPTYNNEFCTPLLGTELRARNDMKVMEGTLLEWKMVVMDLIFIKNYIEIGWRKQFVRFDKRTVTIKINPVKDHWTSRFWSRNRKLNPYTTKAILNNLKNYVGI
jgi:hypothetical protein